MLSIATALAGVPTAAAAEPVDDDRQQVVVQVDDARSAPDVVADAGGEPASTAPLGGSSYASIELSSAGLAKLAADDRVGHVLTRGTTVGPALADSVPLIGAPGRWADGYTGDGKVVVVVDTGIDADFGGTLIGGACFAGSQSASGAVAGHCGPAGDQLRAFDGLCFQLGLCTDRSAFDAAAARPCAMAGAAPERDCLHGTAVAAVAARHAPTPGVAPGAGVYGIRVFDPTGRTADLVDVYAALEHVVSLVESRRLDIASVNLSVATSALFSGTCDDSPALNGAIDAFRSIIDHLVRLRVPVVAAAGNDGSSGQLAFPACLSSAVSVGATDLHDEMAPFSNFSPTLDLLAPGAQEASPARIPLRVPSAPGVSQQWAGTSFAAPHAAGALALIDHEYPFASIDQRVWLLRAGGVRVDHSGSSWWRLGLGAPVDVLNAGALLPGSAALGGTPRVVTGDLDGDGVDDVLAHAPGPATDSVSYGGGDWGFDRHEVRVQGTYEALVGAFSGDPEGPEDIIWYAAGYAADSLWEGRPDRTFAASPFVIDGTFEPHVGDFDGDGWDDVLWYAPGPDRDAIWYGGRAGFASVPVSIKGHYRMAIGDLDGDGRDDIVFHGPEAATDSIWFATSTRGSFTPMSVDIDGTRAPVVGDFDGDGADDLLWYAPGPTPDPLWLGRAADGSDDEPDGDAAAPTGPLGGGVIELSVVGSYEPVVGDIDGDGRDDVVWYAPGPAGDSIWFGTASGRPRSRSFSASGTYVPLVADFDASGSDDIVWFNPAATTSPLWWSHDPQPPSS